MTSSSTSSNLRNRKKRDNAQDESPALAQEPMEPHQAKSKKNRPHHDETSSSSSFRLTPLIKLPIYSRLDVLPFALLYALLIGFDLYLREQEDEEDALARFVVSFLFGVALLGHLALVLACQWNVSFQTLVGYKIVTTRSKQHHGMWTHCFVKSQHAADQAGIVPVRHQELQNKNDDYDSNNHALVVVVNFHDCIFRFATQTPDEDTLLWTRTTIISDENTLPSRKQQVVSQNPSFQPLRYPIDLPLKFFATWQGHDTVDSVTRAVQVYGPNQLLLQLPTLMDLLAEQLVAPFFLFQVFCVTLWSLDEYWYYALFTLCALLLFETTMAFQRLQSLQRLHEAGQRNMHQRVYVRRGIHTDATKNRNAAAATRRTWMLVKTNELVPGDWVSIAATGGNPVPIPADILLVQGSAVCDEALLTGESIPQLKHPLDVSINKSGDDDDNQVLDCLDALHKESVLFGGTNALVTDNSSSSTEEVAPDHGVTGIVLRTGFATTQGSLLRTMAHAQKKVDGVHTWDTFVFILLLVACAIGAAAYVLHEGWQDDRRNRFRLILHVILIVTSVVPPELPMELSLAVTNSFAALVRRAQVYCTELFRIPLAGEVDTCCFDKTGTLTSDEMILRGVRLFPAKPGDEEKALCLPGEGESIPHETIRVMVGCHALAVAGMKRTPSGIEPAIFGDPLELAVLKKTGYKLGRNNTVAPPEIGGNALAILHRFAFSSKLKRMTVLATEQGEDKHLWALTKGAPETLKDFLTSASVPSDYDDVAFYHMSKGRRVLAMGYRLVGSTQKLEHYKKQGREEIERTLTFAGFLVLDCPLKPETKNIMSELKRSGHDVSMITGDALLTAVEVARQIEMVPRPAEHRVYRVQLKDKVNLSADEVLANIEAVEMGCKDGKRVAHHKIRQIKKKGEGSFCLTGDCIVSLATMVASSDSKDEKTLLMDPRVQSVLVQLVPLVSVFARHAPYQKEAVIAALNHAGRTTLFCGDGTNDIGGLKRAHVGISIVSAPEVEAKQREASKSINRAKKKGKKAARASLEESLKQLQEAQQELDQVELGDASVAAPFTSRSSTIRCVKDVIQQGRCTLVTMLQIYKILGVNCLVNAMVLSRLFLHGVKQGDRQMTILGIGVAALFYFVTRAEPLPILSPTRPPSSVLCAEAIVSIILQCLVHLGAILIASEAALGFVDPFDPSLVPDGPFNPNVLNSCTFIILCLTTVNTFAVNYRGEPFMQSLSQNMFLYRSLQACYAVLLVCALEIFPPLNDLMQLTALPTVSDVEFIESSHPLFQLIRMVGFEVFLPGLMAVDTVLAFAVERFVRQ